MGVGSSAVKGVGEKVLCVFLSESRNNCGGFQEEEKGLVIQEYDFVEDVGRV